MAAILVYTLLTIAGAGAARAADLADYVLTDVGFWTDLHEKTRGS